MASVAMLIRGALVNALAFTGSSYLFHRLSKESIDAERKRHDSAIEKLQAAQIINNAGLSEKQKPNSQS